MKYKIMSIAWLIAGGIGLILSIDYALRFSHSLMDYGYSLGYFAMFFGIVVVSALVLAKSPQKRLL
jgi:hypothetical protein